MEQVYKKTGILFKILPCMLIAMYVVMCLFGASVFAVDYKDATYDSSTRSIVYNSKSYPIGETFFNYDYYCIVLSPSLGGYVNLYASNSPFTLGLYGGTIYWFVSSDSKLVYGGASISSLEGLVSWSQGSVGANSHTGSINLASDDFKFIYSNFDLKNENDEVVISKTTERGTSTGDSDNNQNTTGGNTTTGGSTGDNTNTSTDFSSSGVFSWIAKGFELVVDTIKALLSPADLIMNFLNPFSDQFIFKILFENVSGLFEAFNIDSSNFIFSGFFENVKNIVSFLNPASENFFVYKLIDLLKEALKFLFVPSEERINAIIETVKVKFSFVDSVITAVNSIKDIVNNLGVAPKITLNLKETKYTEAQNVVVFDLSWYAPYKTYGDLLITGFIYLMFLWRLFIKLPNIINGIGSSAEPFDKMGEFTETHRNPFHDDY